MPIYEFHCDKCEQDSEILVRSSKWKGTKCPHCGSAKLSKLLSVFASSAGGSQPSAKRSGNGGGSCGRGSCGSGSCGSGGTEGDLNHDFPGSNRPQIEYRPVRLVSL
jgi:putative FmdB family regulatory protein